MSPSISPSQRLYCLAGESGIQRGEGEEHIHLSRRAVVVITTRSGDSREDL